MALAGIRVFILAENRLLREALTRLLNKTDIEVTGASAYNLEVTSSIVTSAANILLLESAARLASGDRFLSDLRELFPSLRVVMIGMEPDKELFLRSVREGVVGYVLKEAAAAEISGAVRACARGEAVCPPSLSLVLFQQAAFDLRNTLIVREGLGLTRREQQLLQMISTGSTNKEIASELNLSEQTVKNHVHRMLRKLGATDRIAAVELCRAPIALA